MGVQLEDEIKIEKKRLRELLIKRLALLTESEIETKSLQAAEVLFRTGEWKTAEWLFCFLSMDRELRSETIIERAFAEGKKVAVPRIRGKIIEFRRITSLNTDWDMHAYGIPEPHADFPVMDPMRAGGAPILVVTPGLGFSSNGARLGRGGGFYDTFFGNASDARMCAAGAAFACQILEGIPVTAHDKIMDVVVTDQGVLECAGSYNKDNKEFTYGRD